MMRSESRPFLIRARDARSIVQLPYFLCFSVFLVKPSLISGTDREEEAFQNKDTSLYLFKLHNLIASLSYLIRLDANILCALPFGHVRFSA